MKIGIFGGTFDPFTVGHYEIVRKVLNDKLVDRIVVLPTVVGYYRKDKTEMFDFADREKIIKAWFKDNKDIILDFSEYDRAVNPRKYYDNPDDVKARRYFHMLLDAIDRYGKENKYVTIVGGDSWNSLKSWYEWENLFTHSDFIVVKRSADNVIDHYIEYTDQCWTCPKTVVEIGKNFNDVSASTIRERLHDMISGMSMGPATTCLGLYLEEVDDYLKTGKTYEDRQLEFFNAEKEAKKFIDSHFNAKDFSMNREKTREENSRTAYKVLESFKNITVKNADLESSDEYELLTHTPIFDVFKSPEVQPGFRPVSVRSPDWVTIIVEKDGKYMREKQFRYGIMRECEEFPCGMVEPNEDLMSAAARELAEETGIMVDVSYFKYIGSCSANPAFMTNRMHYFYVNLNHANYKIVSQKLDEHERLEPFWQDKTDTLKNIANDQYVSVFMLACLERLRSADFL